MATKAELGAQRAEEMLSQYPEAMSWLRSTVNSLDSDIHEAITKGAPTERLMVLEMVMGILTEFIDQPYLAIRKLKDDREEADFVKKKAEIEA